MYSYKRLRIQVFGNNYPDYCPRFLATLRYRVPQVDLKIMLSSLRGGFSRQTQPEACMGMCQTLSPLTILGFPFYTFTTGQQEKGYPLKRPPFLKVSPYAPRLLHNENPQAPALHCGTTHFPQPAMP